MVGSRKASDALNNRSRNVNRNPSDIPALSGESINGSRAVRAWCGGHRLEW